MANYTLIISQGGENKDITPLVEKITWKGRKGSSSRSIVVRLIDDDGYRHARSGIDVEEGCHCILNIKGDEVFRGIVMKTTQSQKKTMSFTAYDNAIYLANNKDTFCYTDKTASDIFRDVCNRFGIPMGSVAATSYRIPELIKKNTTGWDVVADALSLDYKATGTRHYVTSEKGKVSLIIRKENILQWVLEVGGNVTSYSYDKSIEDVRTRLRLISDEGAVVAESSNSAMAAKVGTMQAIDGMDESLNSGQLQELCNTMMNQLSTPSRMLDIDAMGLPDVISGIGVFIRIPHLGLSRTFYVDQDTHTLKGNKYTMRLSLNYASDIDGKKGGGSIGTGIKGALQEIVHQNGELLLGTVISTNPLSIQASGDSKLIIKGSSLVVPQHLTNHKIPYSLAYTGQGSNLIFTKLDGSPIHKHELEPFVLSGNINLYNALKAGDSVHLLVVNNGKKYYVLDREG